MKAEERERIALPPRLVVPETQVELERLERQCFVELESVQQFHTWLDDKRQCRQALIVSNWRKCCRRPTFICKPAYVQPVMGKSQFTE